MSDKQTLERELRAATGRQTPEITSASAGKGSIALRHLEQLKELNLKNESLKADNAKVAQIAKKL